MDSELIRKAAEAIHLDMVQASNLLGATVPEGFNKAFDQMGVVQQEFFVILARAALKVFYEHARTEKPSRVGW